MELFRGDSLIKKIISDDYEFRIGDKIHIAVLENAYSNRYLWENLVEIASENSEINFEISPDYTKKFPVARLLLEIELTTVDGIVQTNQYELNVKADGIYERN